MQRKGPTQSKPKTGDGVSGSGRVSVRVVELLGGILPDDGRHQLDTADVTDIVQLAHVPLKTPGDDALGRTGQLPSGLTPAYLTTDVLGSTPADLIGCQYHDVA